MTTEAPKQHSLVRRTLTLTLTVLVLLYLVMRFFYGRDVEEGSFSDVVITGGTFLWVTAYVVSELWKARKASQVNDLPHQD
jgi:hypothetical protein